MQAFVSRNKVTFITAIVVALLSSTTAVAASYLVVGSSSSSTKTTTLKSSVNGAVLSIRNTNASGGASARGLSITVPSGRAPIVVNSSAGKATYLNADRLDGLDSTAFARKTSESWHEVGTSSGPAFGVHCFETEPGCETRWANYGSDWGTVAFFKDALGIVHLKGLARHSTVTSSTLGCDVVEEIFTLPTGYRPAARAAFATISDNTAARVDIYANGEVRVCVPQLNPTRGWSLEGISFRAAP